MRREFFEYKKGRITSKVVGGRVFFFAERSWITIENELYKRFGGAAAVVLREMGVSYGGHVAKRARSSGSSTPQVVTTLLELGEAAGWGILRSAGDFGLEGRLVISVTDCVFCSSWKESESSSRGGVLETDSCQFMVGMVLGATDELYGPGNVARELACLRSGGEACEIEIVREGRKNK